MEPELQRSPKLSLMNAMMLLRHSVQPTQERGLSDRDLERQLGLSTHQNRMSADDVSKLAAFTYHYPYFRDVLAEQPAIVKFLSNPLVGQLWVRSRLWLHGRK